MVGSNQNHPPRRSQTIMDLKVGFLEILKNFSTHCFAQTLEIKSSPNQSTKPNTTTQTKPGESPSFPRFFSHGWQYPRFRFVLKSMGK